MTILQAIILGIIQGFTEFLPISSSGHLVILPYLLGWEIPQEQIFPFDVLVQLGTLLAVIIYFRKDIVEIFKAIVADFKVKKIGSSVNSRLGWFLVLATIPAGAAGLFLKEVVEQAFGSPTAAAFFLFGTALLLVLAEVIGKKSRSLESMRWLDALWMGLFQVLALFPGLSRSGASMAGGMTRHLDRPSAGRFSFLMSIPIMAAAGLLSIFDLAEVPNLGQFIPVMLIGFLVAGVVGYISITWLLDFVQKHSLFLFAGYCVLLGVLVLVFSFFPQDGSLPAAQAEEISMPQSIVYTSELSWLAPTLAECMQTNLDEPLPLLQSSTAYQPGEMRFTFPVTGESAAYAYQLGAQSLQLNLNTANPLQSLDRSDLLVLLQGTYTTWQEFFQHCASCTFSSTENTFDGEIRFYIYSQSSPYQIALNNVTGLHSGQMNQALFIPSAETLLTQLQVEPNAAGFLPTHWITAATSSVVVNDLSASVLNLPILVLLDQQPNDQIQDFLLCVQPVLK